MIILNLTEKETQWLLRKIDMTSRDVGACWKWRGRAQSLPVVQFRGTCKSVRQLVYEAFVSGAARGNLKMGCGDSQCLNPAHMRDKINPYTLEWQEFLQDGAHRMLTERSKFRVRSA